MMYSKVLIIFAVAALAAANDILEGTKNTQGFKPFFENHYQAQWALTRASYDVFVNTSGVISGINVTDLREAKDGEATIVSGGVGHNNVTINLKSPAVFRGYDFLIAVYSDEEFERGNRGVDEPCTPEVTVSPVAESMPTDKAIAGTGKPSTELPSAGGVTFATTGNPDISVTPTTAKSDVNFGPVSLKPEATGLPAEVTVPKMEMEVPEEVDDVPMKTKISFPPKIHH